MGKYNLYILPLVVILLSYSCGNSKKIQAPQTSSLVPFKEAFHQANSEKMIGHFESAEKLFKKCLVLNPTSAASHFALAQIYKEQKDINKAIEFSVNAFNIDDHNKWYASFLADTYFEMGDYYNSAKYYEIIIEQHSDQNIDNQSKLAQSFIFSNQKEKAIKVLDRMELELGTTPMTSLTKHDLYLELGKDKQAQESLQKLFSENALNINIGLETMDYFLKTRQYDKAMLAIQHVYQIESGNIQAKLGEAEVSLSQKKIGRAFELLTESLPFEEIQEERKLQILESLMGMGLDPRYPEAKEINSRLKLLMVEVYPIMKDSSPYLSLYGQYLMQNNNVDSAQFFFQKAVELNPNDYTAWINLIDSRYQNGQYQKLLIEADKAIVIYPNQPMIYLLKGIAEYELENYGNAQEILNYGRQLVIDNNELQSEFSYHLAKNYWKQDKKEKSAELFEQVFEDNPANARFFFGYAQLLFQDKNTNKALHYAKKAADLDHHQAQYAAFYANLLIEVKDFQFAKSMMERALNADLDNPEYLERYGDIIFFMNDIEKAVDIWKQTNQIKPSTRLDKKITSKSYHE